MIGMKAFATGFITGGIIGAVGLTYALRDRKTRKKMAKDGRKLMHRANDVIENITDMF